MPQHSNTHHDIVMNSESDGMSDKGKIYLWRDHESTSAFVYELCGPGVDANLIHTMPDV